MGLGEPGELSSVPKLSVQRRYPRGKADSSLWPLPGADTGVQSKREFPTGSEHFGAPATDFSYIISALHPPTPTA